VLPLLEDVLQGGVAEALARTAALTRDDVDALDALAAERLGIINTPPAGSLAVDHLEDLPTAVRTRVLRAWAHQHGAAPLTATHTAALDELITDWHGQGAIDLPGRFAVVRESGRLTMHPPSKE
jgi:tRNA(Ile)-lysidine synthase